MERESSIIFSMPDSVPWDEELRVQAAGGGGGQDRKKGSRPKETAGQSLRKGKERIYGECQCVCVCNILCNQST